MEDNLIVIRASIIKFPLLTPGFLSKNLIQRYKASFYWEMQLTTKLIQVLMVLSNHFVKSVLLNIC